MNEPQPSHFAMPFQLLQNIVGYLSDQPWKEVSPLIAEIQKMQPVKLVEEKKQDEPKPTSP